MSKTERHAYQALGPCTQGEWQWSTTQPRLGPGLLVRDYSNVMASSMAGICENAIKSSEFQLSVLMHPVYIFVEEEDNVGKEI